ncbi:MAG: hypothetical protein ABSE82_08380 [Nitrososphaerales archaeon]|jgi:hypothetical protein
MNIQLRLLGATAIYYQCPSSELLSGLMKRRLTDLDFITVSKYASKIPDLFSSLGFEPNERVNSLYGRHRQIYTSSKSSLHVDIFFDKLSFNHVIDLGKRLAIDPFTISLADLFLEKMQIVKISEKDAKDTVVLVHEHDFGSQSDKGTIDADYILKLLSEDWGFYYTVTTNLKKVMEFAASNPSLTENDKQLVSGRLSSLLEKLQASHKSFKWTMRARIGTKAPWYDEAEDVENRE